MGAGYMAADRQRDQDALRMDFLGTVTSGGPGATETLGEALGQAIPPGSVLGLDGELGSGKTCLVRGIARGLGCKDPVSSPTYALMHVYGGARPLSHVDAWLEGRGRAFLSSGVDESFDPNGLAVVEWADRVRDLLPTPWIHARFKVLGPEERTIAFSLVTRGGMGGGPEALDAVAEAINTILCNWESNGPGGA